MQVDRIEAGHDDNASQQAVDVQFCMNQAGAESGSRTRERAQQRREQRIHAAGYADRRHRAAERETPFHRNIGKIVNAISQANPHD